MRLPPRKIYRAFPELDAFDDAKCAAFVAEASRAGGALLKVAAVAAAAVAVGVTLAGFLLLNQLTSLSATNDSLTRWYARNRGIEAAVVAGSLAVPLFLGMVSALQVRDLWLRLAIRRQLRSTECRQCGYSMLGIRVADGRIRCPECGTSYVLAEIGKRAEDFNPWEPAGSAGTNRD